MPKAEPPPKSMMGSPSAASGDPVFTAQVQWEGTTMLVGVFGGSSVAVQHVEKLLHNDFQLGRRHIRALYVRRWTLDCPNADPETNGEEELVHSKVAPTYHVGDPCPCEYCRNSIPQGGRGGTPPTEYPGLPIPHEIDGAEAPLPPDGPEPQPPCGWCGILLPETSEVHDGQSYAAEEVFCSDACRAEADFPSAFNREEALESRPSDGDEEPRVPVTAITEEGVFPAVLMGNTLTLVGATEDLALFDCE